jgi:hypothetical protein
MDNMFCSYFYFYLYQDPYLKELECVTVRLYDLLNVKISQHILSFLG